MTFTLGEVLTVTTGRLLCPIDRLYAILDHLTGESLMTHQLPRACDEASPILLERFPRLADVVVPDDLRSEDDVTTWLAAQTLGTEFDIEPLAAADHTSIDPIAELRMMRPDAQIIVVSESDPAA